MTDEMDKQSKLSQAEMDEIRRRISDYESGVDKGVSWEKLKSELLESS